MCCYVNYSRYHFWSDPRPKNWNIFTELFNPNIFHFRLKALIYLRLILLSFSAGHAITCNRK